MNTRQALGIAIRRRRKAAKMTQSKLQERAEIAQSDVSRIERGKQQTAMDTLERIAKALDTRASQLLAEADAIAGLGEEAATAHEISVAAGVRHVPIVSWVDAGKGREAVDSYATGTGEGVIPVSVKVGRGAYALRVDGASMTNPGGEPSFPSGQIVVVDPTRELLSGSFIIARFGDDGKATFKRYVEDGPQRMLVPLNPQYPVIHVDRPMTYCGTVVAKAETPI